MEKQVFLVLLVIAMLLVATGSAAAKATRTEFTGIFYSCGTTGPPARMWTTGDGRVLHVRGEPGFGYAVSEHPYYNAYTIGLTNYDLNTVTGSGGIHGTFEKDVAGVEGGWLGTIGGHFKDGLDYFTVVGHGTGDLVGMKYFAKFAPTENPGDDPCPDDAGAVYDVTGVILDTRGE